MVSAEQQSSPFTPSVSVIIAVYNGADTIATCLQSLLEQTYPAEVYEIIVVENGSTDDTTRVVDKFPVRLFHSDRLGPAVARNLGLTRSQADIVAFTDADCIAHPDWLTELVKPYVDPMIGGVGGAILAYDHANLTAVERFSAEFPPLVNFASGGNEFLPHLYTANASYRRDFVSRVGGFNPDLVTAEDVDLAWRLQLQAVAELCYAPDAIIYHHHRATPFGLAQQYRQYGFGEILLDTMYRRYPGYPRGRLYQLRCILAQMAALPRYALSAMLRQVRLVAGQATPFQAAVPGLWFLVESSNIIGKLEGLVVTRLMTDAQPVLEMEADGLVRRFYPDRKR